MDNFKAVYKILSTLEKAMDYPEFDISQINASRLGVSEERWCRYIEMMVDVGYIKGVNIEMYIDGSLHVDAENMRITFLNDTPKMVYHSTYLGNYLRMQYM